MSQFVLAHALRHLPPWLIFDVSQKNTMPPESLKSVALPDAPREKEFEEFLSAYFQDCGLYVERNIIDRQEEEVLEIDLITTDYNNSSSPKSKLYEVKSGNWGFNEIFKLGGWLSYLKLKEACLIVAKDRSPIEFYEKIAKNINVSILVISEHEKAKDILTQKEGLSFSPSDTSSLWRFSYWVERQTLKLLTIKKKSSEEKKAYKAIDWYISLVNNRTFFTESHIRRAQRLYQAYQAHPNISAKLGHELEGGDFDLAGSEIPKAIFDKTFYKCEFTDIAISSYVEHRARLSILKAAIDYKIRKEIGSTSPEDAEREAELLTLLPDTFKDGLDELATHAYYFKYPVFWQWFMWFMGGFILKDYEAKDYEFLSQKTGIPLSEIPNALKAYDILFPRSGGWFTKLYNSNISVLSVFPQPFCGLGAHFRRIAYGEGDVGKMKLSGQYTANDLSKWINQTVELLSRNL